MRPAARFLILAGACSAGRQSHTAAALITAVASRAACTTASRISRAVPTRTSRACSGGRCSVGPVTRVTRAPRRTAARAMANPIFPEEWLETKRTGSMGSTVGPAVTRIRSSARSLGVRTISRASRISSGAAILPRPTTPHASSPGTGPTKW